MFILQFLVPQQLAMLVPVLRVCLQRKGVRVVSQRFELPGLVFSQQTHGGTSSEVDCDSYFPTVGTAFLYQSTWRDPASSK